MKEQRGLRASVGRPINVTIASECITIRFHPLLGNGCWYGYFTPVTTMHNGEHTPLIGRDMEQEK